MKVPAQDSSYYKAPNIFEGRLIGGLNFCQIVGDAYGGFHRVGLNAGGMVYVHFIPIFGASMEVLYTQKGARGGNVQESYTVGTYINKYYLNLNYAEAALLLHLDLFIFDYEAGISYAQLLKSKEWAEADVPIYINPALGYFNSYDIDYTLGLSMKLNKHWYVNMRYQYSAISIRPWARVYPRYSDGSPEQYNELMSLRLVYLIR